MNPSTLLLTERDVARLIDLRTVIRVVRSAFVTTARGRAVMPSKVYLPLEGSNDFRAMPAWLRTPNACGVKWVNVHPDNRRRGLPTVMALIILSDPRTGVPLAVMDGRLITKLRTAAAAAVAAAALARPQSRVVGLIGCGAQADAQLEALRLVRRFTRVQVWGAQRGEAAAFCRRMRRRLRGVQLIPSPTVQSAVRGADIIVTLTPSTRPLVRRSWVAPGTHINAIGADAPGKQELDPRILRDSLVVVDERTQALHGGELNVPVHRGEFRASQIHAELGDVLLRRATGRRSPQQVTVFDSTGLAIHDVAVAHEVFMRASRRRVGRRIAWFESSRS